MPKRLLIVEPSSTVQKMFSSTLSKDDFTLHFVTTAIGAIQKLADLVPDAFFINAEVTDIDSFELARLIKKIRCFENMPSCIYATNQILFDKYFTKLSGITHFEYIDPSTLEAVVEEVVSYETGEIDKKAMKEVTERLDPSNMFLSACNQWKSDNFKNAIRESLFSLISYHNSSNDLVSNLLSLIAELCETPLVALFIIEHDGPHCYYISEETIEQQEIDDFFKVCAVDFEKAHNNINTSHIENVKLKSNIDLLRFYTKELPLSSYECKQIPFSSGKKNASFHIVRSGNFTDQQMDSLNFCCQNAGIVLENALALKSKIFYEQRIRKAFSRFVPEQIIDDLAKKDEQKVSVGESRQIAILFSDIRSFTNISERNKPDVMVSFLNRYFTIMVDIIKKHGGTIDKFIGDAIMAEFGTPISYEDNCRRAAMAGYEMRQALPNVPLEDLILPEGMTFNIGIGIHYGDCIVGSIGSKDKTDYSVIGDAVNLASRLEGLTKTYGVQLLVSENMQQEITSQGNPEKFVFRHLDNVRVKGKKNAVPIYAIDREQDEFPFEYRDAYSKGMDLYIQGIFRLAKDYFTLASKTVPEDKAAKLMISRCEQFIDNPPENWDGAISYTTK